MEKQQLSQEQLRQILSSILGVTDAELEDAVAGLALHYADDSDCGVKDELQEKKTMLSLMPEPFSKDEKVIQYTVAALARAHQELSVETEQRTAHEEQMLMQKPDHLDLNDPAHEHLRLHIELRTIENEIRRREAITYRRFCEIVKEKLI